MGGRLPKGGLREISTWVTGSGALSIELLQERGVVLGNSLTKNTTGDITDEVLMKH